MHRPQTNLMLAIHTFVSALDQASPKQIKAAINECHSINDEFIEPATKRAIYNRLGYMMRQCK